MKIIEPLAIHAVGLIMIILTLVVGFIPMIIIAYYNLPELDLLARIIGCILVIPMLRLTLLAIDTTFDWADRR